ncbi:hypothetical protein PoB_005742600 [Plakobranchus ocellatus]|uniref:Uncharacterized protein n=1 Tax=Plakobranchus ocellatus TaxID=259542 RepID=A0AAV4CDV1_9GAST|nr:hypothetical protein PoB_005742600 [Plakobranchus ocellatus]
MARSQKLMISCFQVRASAASRTRTRDRKSGSLATVPPTPFRVFVSPSDRAPMPSSNRNIHTDNGAIVVDGNFLPNSLRNGTACPQQGNLKLSGPPSDQSAGGGARIRDRWVPADLKADSLRHRRHASNREFCPRRPYSAFSSVLRNVCKG